MNVDHVLGAVGLGCAIGAAALPWHVWSNPDRYSPPRIVFERLDDDPAVAAFVPLREVPLVTGAIAPRIDEAAPSVGAAEPRLVFVSATHALARLPGVAELTLLRPGSKLGDGDAVASFALREGRWTLMTRKGRVLAIGR